MIIDSILTIGTNELSDKEWRRFFKRLSYVAGGSLWEPWKVYPHKHVVKVPRGAWMHLPSHITYHDNRRHPAGHVFPFCGELDSEGFDGQKAAVKSMWEQEQGVIVAQPGFGKTEVAAAFCAEVGTPSLILVHTEDILQQWVSRLERLIPDANIGVIRGKEIEIGDITVTTVQTFKKWTDKFSGRFGCVILDECHHAPASTFDEILNRIPAFYRFGFTATDKRADGRHPYIYTVLGPVIYRRKFKSKVPVTVVPVKSHNFNYKWRGSWDWRNLLNALKADEKRNAVIAKIAVREIKRGNTTLVLSREIDHLEAIKLQMGNYLGVDAVGSYVEILAAKLKNKKQREEILNDFRSGKLKCVLATQLADEALDVPVLSRVLLTFPGKHDGRIIQQVGRALREHPGKVDAVIYDIVDDRVGVLRRQWMQRKQAYRSMGIKVKKRKVKS